VTVIGRVHYSSLYCCKASCEDSNTKNSTLLLRLNQPLSIDEISNNNLIKIVNLECSDDECNMLTWKCLGYKYNTGLNKFELSEKVFPKWASKYPIPPDLIGITKIYSDPAIDRPVRDASMDLMRSIPKDFKGGVRNLESEGFRGYKLSELTPNKTRRAQLVNWIIYYRERLFGKTIEQLREEAEKKKLSAVQISTEQDISPSEVMFQRKRLDTLE
jgi:hypothetical protein